MTMSSSNVGTNSVYASAAMGVATNTMSPDALLAYCEMQLGSIDAATKDQMDSQKLQLQQRTAVQSVNNTLQGYGTNGPSTVGDYNSCDDAFTKAIQSLPPNDPVADQLTAQKAAFEAQYGQGAPVATDPPTSSPDPSTSLGQTGSSADWQKITGTLSTLAENIKSDSEIQMLQLQDLVSERQQAVEQITGMMTKQDQTLEEGAKAIGQ